MKNYWQNIKKKILVYHDASTVLNDWLWFTYEEFDKILADTGGFLRKISHKKRTLKDAVDRALKKRL
jgi:hypothetical protein